MLGLDLKGAKKVREDNKSSTFALSSGHQITVAHDSLSPAHKAQIKKLPIHAYAGDDVQGPTPSKSPVSEEAGVGGDPLDPSRGSVEAEVDNSLTGNAPGQPAGSAPNEDVLSTAPPSLVDQSFPEPGSTNAVQPAMERADQVEPGSPLDVTQEEIPKPDATEGLDLNKVITDTQAGNQAQVNAQVARDRQMAAVEANHQKELQAEQDKWNKSSQAMIDQQNLALKDIKDHVINPKHYQESMSSGQKIGTAIGLLLGGMSSGISGHNPALEFMNQQIDRDIQAQKFDQENRVTLFNAYLHQYGNAVTAEGMTRATLAGAYASQIRQAAANSDIPMAKAAGLVGAAQFERQIIPLVQNAHLMSQVAQYTGANPAAQVGPESKFQVALNAAQNINPAVGKDLASKYIPNVGVASAPPTQKDKDTISAAQLVFNRAQDAQNLAQTKGTAWNPLGKDKQEADSIQADLKASIDQMYGGSRIPIFLAKQFDELVRNPGSWNTTRAATGFKQLSEIAKSHRNVLLNKYQVKKFSGTK